MQDGFRLSRRRLLAGLGSVGLASAGAGLGTSAYFSDGEEFAGNELVAGELDLKVSWDEHYWGPGESAYAHHAEPGETPWLVFPAPEDDPAARDVEIVVDDQSRFLADTRVDQYPSGGLNPRVSPCDQLADVPDLFAETGRRPLVDISDVKPGDFGEVTFDFALCTNPGYLWLNGNLLADAEGELTEPEAADPDEDGTAAGELADAIRVLVWYDEDCDNLPDTSLGEEVVFSGSLREALALLATGNGIPLDGDRESDFDARQCYQPAPTVRCLGFLWYLPVDHGNELQGDSVTFDLGFYAEQCRHNDGAGMPARREVTLDGRFAEAFGFEPSTATAARGAGSWGSLDADREFLYLGPAFVDFNTLPPFTVDDVESVTYSTYADSVTDPSHPNVYLTVYTDPATDPDPDASWYGKRLTGDPAYAGYTATPSVNAPANQWNEWTTADAPDNTLAFYDANRTGVGYGYTDGTLPVLADLQGTSAFDWSNWRSSAAPTAIDYGGQAVKTMALSTGSAWHAGFTGYLDDVTVRLTGGERLRVDLEP